MCRYIGGKGTKELEEKNKRKAEREQKKKEREGAAKKRLRNLPKTWRSWLESIRTLPRIDESQLGLLE